MGRQSEIKKKFVPPFGPIRPGRSTKRFYFVSAPAPKNGCGEFLLLDTTTAYAKKIGDQEGSCASLGYDIPAGSATGNFALPKPLGFIGRSVTVQFFTRSNTVPRQLFVRRNRYHVGRRSLITLKQTKSIMREIGKRQKIWNSGYLYDEGDEYDYEVGKAKSKKSLFHHLDQFDQVAQRKDST